MNKHHFIAEPTPRDAIIEQIFSAYRHAGTLRKNFSSGEMKDHLEVVRYHLDKALKRLYPLSDYHRDVWSEVRRPFRD